MGGLVKEPAHIGGIRHTNQEKMTDSDGGDLTGYLFSVFPIVGFLVLLVMVATGRLGALART